MSYTATRGDGSALPSWLGFDAGTRTFSGTPASVGDAGTLTVKVTANDGNGGNGGNGGTVSDEFHITVSDGGGLPVTTFASSASSAGEGSGTRNVTFDLFPAPTSAITVVLSRSGTASEGQDYAPLDLAVDVPAGTTSVNVPVSITNDTDDEANETVILTLGSGTGYTVGSGNIHTLTITDNDDPPPNTPVVSISASPSSMTEGSTATFTLTASPVPAGSISVAVTVTDSGDFACGGTGARTVSVGTSGTATFTVATENDAVDEPDGTITATVNTGTGYAPHSTEGSASVTVNDNDAPGPDTPVVSIAVNPPTLMERDHAIFTLTARPAPTQDIVVAVTVAGGSFATGGPRTVTVGTTGTASFTVPTTDDEMEEPNGTITVTVNTGMGYSPHNTDGSAAVTVNDNDGADGDSGATSTPVVPPTVSISGERAVINEGDDAVFTLTASPAPREDLPVTVQVMGSGDFASGGAGLRMVSIPPSGTASFTVPTTDDHTDEPNGTITATVNTGTGYAPHNTDGSASVTVNDNDVPGLRFPRSSLTVARGAAAPTPSP